MFCGQESQSLGGNREPLEAGKVGEEGDRRELALVSKGIGYLRNLKVILKQEQMAF